MRKSFSKARRLQCKGREISQLFVKPRGGPIGPMGLLAAGSKLSKLLILLGLRRR